MKFPQFPGLKSSRAWAWSVASGLITILAALASLEQNCQAQQPLASQSQSGGSADPLNNISWYSGPQRVSLGDIADIEIPPGYHFTDVHGARMILARFHDAIPDDLLGILAPTSGHWMAILEFSPVGYVKDPAITQINSGKALKQILDQIAKQGQSSITSLSWQSPPSYNALNHVLDWSLKVETPSSKLLNQTAVIFGRHGVLQLTVVEHASDTGAAHSVKQVASSIIFKPGEHYADYRRGDKIADIGLAEIISGETHPQTAGAFGGGFGSVVGWAYGGLALCLLTGGVLAVRGRNKSRRRQTVGAVQAAAPAIKNKSPVISVSPQLSSARRDLSKPLRRRRRKRIFDYTKFYSKIVRELSLHSYGPPLETNGKFSFDGHAKVHGYAHGHGHDDSNGHTNQPSDIHASPGGTNENQKVKSEIEELIAIQRSLIEQQKCFLEEQTRLIEEKRGLIEEQMALLKAQCSLAAEQQQPYPLKIAQ